MMTKTLSAKPTETKQRKAKTLWFDVVGNIFSPHHGLNFKNVFKKWFYHVELHNLLHLMPWSVCFISQARGRKNVHSYWSASHICYAHMFTVLQNTCSPRGPAPTTWKAAAERKREQDRDSERIRRVWSNWSYWHCSFPQADLKHVCPWWVDRHAVLGLGIGRGASWSANRVVLWAGWLTHQWSRDAGCRGGLFLGPSMLMHCWKWVRQTQERNQEGVHSAEVEDKEASKQWRLFTVSWKSWHWVETSSDCHIILWLWLRVENFKQITGNKDDFSCMSQCRSLQHCTNHAGLLCWGFYDNMKNTSENINVQSRSSSSVCQREAVLTFNTY